ncbi:Cytochrome P450 CYP4 [Hyalella azteca]|uniref:Cytochrome P450 CYP4 n=1 Tax=Hyalella azteca TaxID=294128 RepID=A0A6A0GVE4_HYAAZ|nr:Cytochrome P450 CYP4 [Hyalella azteca]
MTDAWNLMQAKVHEELDAVLGDDEFISSEHLTQLKYLERCVKEALRLYPSVPIIGRVSAQDLVIDGKLIPAGTNLMIFIYLLHRDPEQFPDPETFDPDRFLPEQIAKRHPYAYVPFSAGPRNCIGTNVSYAGQKFALMEEKVILASVLRRFTIKSLHRPHELRMMGEIILRPKRGVMLKMWPRNN